MECNSDSGLLPVSISESGIMAACLLSAKLNPVPHDSSGKAMDVDWESNGYSPILSMFENCHGLSIKTGPFDRIIAIEIKNWKTNAKWNEITKDIYLDIERTCHVKIKDNLILYYLYENAFARVNIPSQYVDEYGIEFLSQGGRASYHGIQEKGWSIDTGNIYCAGVFLPAPEALAYGLASMLDSSDSVTYETLRIVGYPPRNPTSILNIGEEISNSITRYETMFALSYLPMKYVTDVLLWHEVAILILACGHILEPCLYEFTFRDNGKHTPMDIVIYNNVVSAYFKQNELSIGTSHYQWTMAYIRHYIGDSPNTVEYQKEYEKYLTKQFDHNDWFTMHDFESCCIRNAENTQNNKFKSLNELVSYVCRYLHRFVRYLYDKDLFIIKTSQYGSPAHIKTANMIDKHSDLLYEVATKNRKGETIYQTMTINPYFIYKYFEHGKIKGVVSIPYTRLETPYQVLSYDSMYRGYLNTFPGYIGRMVDHVDTDRVQVILDHIKEVWADNNESYYRWIIGRLALMVQYPREKHETLMVLFGKPGCGKTCVLEFLRRHVFGEGICAETIGVSKIAGKFNYLVEDKVLIIVNELANSEDYKGVNAQFETMKSLITDKSLVIERKGIDSYQSPNFLNFIITTNNRASIPIRRDDRRFVVFNCSPKYVKVTDSPYSNPNQIEVDKKVDESKAYFNNLFSVMNSPSMGNHFYTFLMRNVSDKYLERSRTLIETQIRTEIMRIFESKPYIYWCELTTGIHMIPKSIVQYRKGGPIVSVENLYQDFATWFKRSGYTMICAKNTFSADVGVRSVEVRLNSKSIYIKPLPTTCLLYEHNPDNSQLITYDVMGKEINRQSCVVGLDIIS